MADDMKPFPFTACVDHLRNPSPIEVFRKIKEIFQEIRGEECREIVTVSAATCNFKSEKSLEDRQAEITFIRERNPDFIPVIIQKDEESQILYPDKMKFLVRAKSNLGAFFKLMWGRFYGFEFSSQAYSLLSTVVHKDPIFEKLMSSVYEEYKDEDGCLYITLSGEMRDVLPEPIPSNIITWTFYL